jgi:hypothetical protein
MMAIHTQIAADLATAKAQALHAGPIPCDEFDALQSLMESASAALSASLPASFEHHGQTYRLMVDIQRARLAIFESMTAEKSMLITIVTTDEKGGK